jgi:hypothetical protein
MVVREAQSLDMTGFFPATVSAINRQLTGNRVGILERQFYLLGFFYEAIPDFLSLVAGGRLPLPALLTSVFCESAGICERHPAGSRAAVHNGVYLLGMCLTNVCSVVKVHPAKK